MKSRSERIADAEFRLAGIKLVIDPLLKQLNDAEVELNRAKTSYDIGEAVRVTKTCRRGCCTELEFEGSVVAENNGTYSIKATSGHVHEFVSTYDMKRL